jgi:hypothetical protein
MRVQEKEEDLAVAIKKLAILKGSKVCSSYKLEQLIPT